MAPDNNTAASDRSREGASPPPQQQTATKTSVHTGAGLPWYTLLAGGGISACVAEIATIPIDTTKVRMQLDTQRGGTNNMVSAMKKIYGEEGLLAFWKGLNAGLQRQIVFASLRLSLYERIRSIFQGDAATTTLPAKIASGLAAGTIGITIANPTDVVKIRLQAEGKLAQGVEPRYKGAMHAYKKNHRRGRHSPIVGRITSQYCTK
eukprot:gb/GECG01011480.1/.p1 GENE.gb/GECG01011480.1/~~gb/GECG01011480.1/.p1  ORF type:complete len:206 (+),score=19.97 gb/GECG01011480.1/:1-618(+)